LYRFFIFLEEEEAGGGGWKAFQEACREAGPRQEQGRKGRKRRRMKRKEKERVCTRLMELLETGRAAGQNQRGVNPHSPFQNPARKDKVIFSVSSQISPYIYGIFPVILKML